MQEQNIRGMNFALCQMEDDTGMPRGFFGRYAVAPPKPTTVIGEFILNNIKIDRSAIGLLNTGSIGGSVENIDVTISMVSTDPTIQSFQEALKDFTEAVLRSTEASSEQKEVILELMSAIADEVHKPKEKRRFKVIKTLLENIQELAKSLNSLHAIWQTLNSIIIGIFS